MCARRVLAIYEYVQTTPRKRVCSPFFGGFVWHILYVSMCDVSVLGVRVRFRVCMCNVCVCRSTHNVNYAECKAIWIVVFRWRALGGIAT